MKIYMHARGPFVTNTYIVLAEDETHGWVIDPTLETEQIADDLAERDVKILAVINTHGHLDHVYNNALFCERFQAPLWIHQMDVPLLENLATQAKMFEIPATKSPAPDRFLEEGDVLALDGFEFTILHTPGHSPGSLSLVTHGLAIVGDVLFAGGIGRTDLWQGDFDTLRDSIHNKLFPLPEETRVLSGHGPETTIGAEKRNNPFVGENATFSSEEG